MRMIRPGFGLPTKYPEQALGVVVRQDMKKGTTLRLFQQTHPFQMPDYVL
jgi:sialic acid synthase SpsE